VLGIRYEDMLSDPQRIFRLVLDHIGIRFDQAQLDHAIEMSSFGKLSALEERDGFIERSRKQERFFRKGENRGGADLPEQIRARIIADHGAVMRHMKYL